MATKLTKSSDLKIGDVLDRVEGPRAIVAIEPWRESPCGEFRTVRFAPSAGRLSASSAFRGDYHRVII